MLGMPACFIVGPDGGGPSLFKASGGSAEPTTRWSMEERDDHDDPLYQIECALGKTQVSGALALGGKAQCLPSQPRIEIVASGRSGGGPRGAGRPWPLRYPLEETRAKALIGLCDPAPCIYSAAPGSSSTTASAAMSAYESFPVQNRWQLAPSKFRITSPGWDKGIKELVTGIAERVGLKGVPIDARLRRMLVYEPGGSSHGGRFKDDVELELDAAGDVVEHVFAVLVIYMPSVHEFGELAIYGSNNVGYVPERTWTGKPDAESGLHYVVYYAGVELESKLLLRGYRVALTYSLVWPKDFPNPPPSYVSTPLPDAVAAWIQCALRPTATKRHFVYFCTREYSHTSMAQRGALALQGKDLERYDALAAANLALPPERRLRLYLVEMRQSAGASEPAISTRPKTYMTRRKRAAFAPLASVARWYPLSGGAYMVPRERQAMDPEAWPLVNPDRLSRRERWGSASEECGIENESSRIGIVAWPIALDLDLSWQFIGAPGAFHWLQSSTDISPDALVRFLKGPVVGEMLSAEFWSNAGCQEDCISELLAFATAPLYPPNRMPQLVICHILRQIARLRSGDAARALFEVLYASMPDFKLIECDPQVVVAMLDHIPWEIIRRPFLSSINLSDNSTAFHKSLLYAGCMRNASGVGTSPSPFQDLFANVIQQLQAVPAEYLTQHVGRLDLLRLWTLMSGHAGWASFAGCCHALTEKVPTGFLGEILQGLVPFLKQLPPAQLPHGKALASKRVTFLLAEIEKADQSFSWEMPLAVCPSPHDARLQQFLRSPAREWVHHGIFQSISGARYYASKVQTRCDNASIRATAEGRGAGAFVRVTKTRDWFESHPPNLAGYRRELDMLQSVFGIGLGESVPAAPEAPVAQSVPKPAVSGQPGRGSTVESEKDHEHNLEAKEEGGQDNEDHTSSLSEELEEVDEESKQARLR